MNLEILVRWGQRALLIIDRLEQRPDKKVSHENIIAKLGWLTAFREPLKEWDALCHVAATVEHFVRTQGLWNGCEAELSNGFDDRELFPKAKHLQQQLIDFVKEEAMKARPNERLVGSNEIIESVFGKLKRLEQDQFKSGFTLMVLGVASIIAETTLDTIKKAMEAVPTKRVIEWAKNTLG